MGKKKDYYSEIDKVLQSFENYQPYHEKSMDWISDRIVWCWKWRKISKEQMVELAERATTIFERR